jgi:N-acetylglucosaminyl-diphospho-decaprenol L-rhamnosyltransferase
MKINVIILNYNGEKLIPECLPSIIEARGASKHNVRITVIDNESTDKSLEVLACYGKAVEVVKLKNRVFCSYAEVIREQKDEIAVLLNNDLRVDRDFIDTMAEVFEKHDNAFMVAPKCFDFTGEALEGGRSKGYIKFGWFGGIARFKGWEKEIEIPAYTFQTGFGAVRRDRFLELGGYEDLYLPGRLEDTDICFRAWKKGWKSYYAPKSVVYHLGGASFKEKFGKKGISSIDSRNSALFFWKNINDPWYWAMHIFFMPVRILWWLSRGDTAAVKGLFQAFGRLPQVMKKRNAEKNAGYKLSDREVFKVFE